MKITNQSKNTLLADTVLIADGPFSRMRGLLGKKSLPDRHALIISPCNSVHTCFMRFPIDVLFLNKENKVIAVVNAMKPFRLSKVYFNVHFVIELPAGTTGSSLTSPGDTLFIR